MDMTRFCIGYDRAHWVINIDLDKLLLLTHPVNQNYITSIINISGKRKTIPPVLILYKIYIPEKWAEENNLNDNILLTTNPIRYFNNELVL